jgi:hypothetical protein
MKSKDDADDEILIGFLIAIVSENSFPMVNILSVVRHGG